VSKSLPRAVMRFVLGRCHGRSGEDDREGREHFAEGVKIARAAGMEKIRKKGEKEEKKWFGKGGEGKSEGKLW